MRLLLDTHVFLWFISGSDQIPPQVQGVIRDPDNDVFLSVASVWEAVLKHQIGKLQLPAPPAEYLPEQRLRHKINSLAIEEATLQRLAKLAPLHRDPFDRIIVAQAQQHELLLATVDSSLRQYPVAMLAWG